MQRNAKIITRLTALWALSEAGLGGVLHAIQFPFTGLLVGGFAIVLISLIAYFSDHKWDTIFRSLLVVLIIKLAVSPHSPPTSYLAVSFQAFMAALIFNKLRINMWSTMLLGVTTLIESAIQKILVVWIVYGSSLWTAIDGFSEYVIQKMGMFGELFSSHVLISVYLWLYALLGLVIGYMIYDIIQYMDYNQGNVKYQIQAIEFEDNLGELRKRRGLWKQWILFGTFFALIAAYYFFVKGGKSVWGNWLYITLRSAGILLLWYYVLARYFKKYFAKYLERKKYKVQKEVDETMTLLPYLRKVAALSWQENKHTKGPIKFRDFLGDTILYSIHLKLEE